MTRHIVLAVILLAALPTFSAAQRVATFAELPLRLNVGDTVTVDDAGGTRVRGRLVRMAPEMVVLRIRDADVTFTADRVRRVATCCDSLLNGPLIGFGAGAVLGVVFALGFSDHPSAEDGLIGGAMFGGLGAGLGLGLDALMRFDRTVYEAPALTTRVTLASRRQQVSVVYSW